jgi:hypothetical protein
MLSGGALRFGSDGNALGNEPGLDIAPERDRELAPQKLVTGRAALKLVMSVS